MVGVAVIKLSSISQKAADSVMQQIKTIAMSAGVKFSGPVPLPTKHISHTTRKAPGADGSHTYEKWELRVHKRLIQLYANDQALRQVMRIPVPDTVQIEISLS
ncbi:30S ribosomal protein S10 [Candidatus Marsarchaeota archaeon]|jgi:small subunit ribosomal protein S10|nr:30S ribosomal protein S10 [Candidatus Marsarchaeota archaeon]MCL5099755.1 30S ribosomal protein S10 [Candidatus Marsarchaeota archaeon]